MISFIQDKQPQRPSFTPKHRGDVNIHKTFAKLTDPIPARSRHPLYCRAAGLTSIMTPQMLITIPHAAIFGPQNSNDGMSKPDREGSVRTGTVSIKLNRENGPWKGCRTSQSADQRSSCHSGLLGRVRKWG